MTAIIDNIMRYAEVQVTDTSSGGQASGVHLAVAGQDTEICLNF